MSKVCNFSSVFVWFLIHGINFFNKFSSGTYTLRGKTGVQLTFGDSLI